MAANICPECQSPTAPGAAHCPSCGHPLNGPSSATIVEKKRGWSVWWLVGCLALALIGGVGALVLVGVGVALYTTMQTGSLEDRAKIDVKALDQAVAVYFARHAQYPGALRDLAQRQPDGAPAMLQEGALLDPWGQPYVYDVNARDPVSDRPLIYSPGPPGQNKPIRNWEGK